MKVRKGLQINTFGDLWGFYTSLVIPAFLGLVLLVAHGMALFIVLWVVTWFTNEPMENVFPDPSAKTLFFIALYFGAMGGLLLGQEIDKD